MKTRGADIRFKDLNRDEIRTAFQETVKHSLRNSELDKFFFKEDEIGDLPSLAEAFLRLLYSCRESMAPVPDARRHFLECRKCQIVLLATIEYFFRTLIFFRKIKSAEFSG